MFNYHYLIINVAIAYIIMYWLVLNSFVLCVHLSLSNNLFLISETSLSRHCMSEAKWWREARVAT